LPTGDVVKPRPVSVAVELLEPGLLVRQRTAHLVVADFAQPDRVENVGVRVTP